MRRLGLLLVRVLVVVAAAGLAAYAIDWAVYKLRGSPQSIVQVSQFMSIPLKGQKIEDDYLGSANVACAVALFPHGGEDACWHLRRHKDQWDNAGASAY
jgi:hypothetical protein